MFQPVVCSALVSSVDTLISAARLSRASAFVRVDSGPTHRAAGEHVGKAGHGRSRANLPVLCIRLHSVELRDHLIHGGRAQAIVEHHEPGSSDSRVGAAPGWHNVEVLIG